MTIRRIAQSATKFDQTMDRSKAIRTVEWFITTGKAYSLDVPQLGTFVCCDSQCYNMARPQLIIRYQCLDGYMRNNSDFALWAPYTDGLPSPWGNGQPTANLCLI